jgi:arginine-tRNA-protein transferase
MKFSPIVAPSSSCGYLPSEVARYEYGFEAELSPGEYMQLLKRGWRRFGRTLFRPRCRACNACRSLRIDVARFQPNRSQRRTRKVNEHAVRLEIGRPTYSAARLELYHRFHDHQTEAKGWPVVERDNLMSYAETFLDNPFPNEEWCYYLNDTLVGVGFVDALPAGLSAIYFYHDPGNARRSLGTWNVLSLIEEAARRNLPHVYLGYFVGGCGSLQYKARFTPNEVLGTDGVWREFRATGNDGS